MIGGRESALIERRYRRIIERRFGIQQRGDRAAQFEASNSFRNSRPMRDWVSGPALRCSLTPWNPASLLAS